MPELIDRQAVRLLESDADAYTGNWNDDYEKGFCDAIYKVLKLSTIEAEPVRHGRWIPTEYDSYADGAPVWDKWECSECNNEHSGEENTLSAFCPECGARMDADEITEIESEPVRHRSGGKTSRPIKR